MKNWWENWKYKNLISWGIDDVRYWWFEKLMDWLWWSSFCGEIINHLYSAVSPEALGAS